ncbi:MucBP domain-containing protein [Enterococcus termitis]
MTIESSRQETLKIGDYSLEPVEQQAKNEQALFRYQIDLKALGYNDIEPGQEIELVLTTDAPFADRATITDITLAQRIVSSVYGTQSIYKQQTPVENQGSVLFHFVDEEGNELEKTVEINDSVGQDFNYTVPEITGYQPLQKDYQGVFLNLKQEFVVVYQPQGVILPYEIGMVSVHYQDTEGKQLAEPKQMTGELGAAYETTPLSIEGYTLIETPKDAKGTYKKGEHQIIYVYQKQR